jgi:hypothetical protein
MVKGVCLRHKSLGRLVVRLGVSLGVSILQDSERSELVFLLPRLIPRNHPQ